MTIRATALLAALSLSLAAHAGDLVNQDSKTYPIAVKGSGGTMKASIAGKTTKSGICPDKCTIEVEGAGSISLAKGESALIMGGKLQKK